MWRKYFGWMVVLDSVILKMILIDVPLLHFIFHVIIYWLIVFYHCFDIMFLNSIDFFWLRRLMIMQRDMFPWPHISPFFSNYLWFFIYYIPRFITDNWLSQYFFPTVVCFLTYRDVYFQQLSTFLKCYFSLISSHNSPFYHFLPPAYYF